jgi:phosphoribosylanthranilate isomerase
MRVKICGIRDLKTALAAIEAGADALGFVFAEKSPRRISPDAAREISLSLPPFIARVGVFVDVPAAVVLQIADFCRLDVLQLHGGEPPDYCRSLPFKVVKAFRVRDGHSLRGANDYPADAVLLDAFVPGLAGGTGESFNWELVVKAGLKKPVILAGGLSPANVRQAVAAVRPYAVDVSSGVETDGKKDLEKIRLFIQRAKEVL